MSAINVTPLQNRQVSESTRIIDEDSDITRLARSLSLIMAQHAITKLERIGEKVFIDTADGRVYVYRNGELVRSH